MFTHKMVANPNYDGQRYVTPKVQVTVCACGSTNVGKRYDNDNYGEVCGVIYVCRDCGATESF